jgi:hypothetical protein
MNGSASLRNLEVLGQLLEHKCRTFFKRQMSLLFFAGRRLLRRLRAHAHVVLRAMHPSMV